MQKYSVLKTIAIFSGIVMLSEKQASAREHALEPLGDGAFEVLSRVEFKAGEVLGFDGEPPKDLMASLEPVNDEPANQRKPTRADLDDALAGLPGDQKDPEYVVKSMRRYFGDLFNADDEAMVRDLVKPAPAK